MLKQLGQLILACLGASVMQENAIPTKFYCAADSKKPTINNPDDAGFDLYLNYHEKIFLEANTTFKLPTGLFCEINKGECGIILETSGNGFKRGIRILGRVIDGPYRGEVMVALERSATYRKDYCGGKNGDRESIPLEDMILNPGQKIAQMVIVPRNTLHQFVNSKDEFTETVRGEKGFGSSDAKTFEKAPEGAEEKKT